MSNSKPVYDLEARAFQFAKSVRLHIKKLPQTTSNIEDGKQVIRFSGSIGANYIESNEALSKKDFLNRMKISRKEAKESIYFLRLVHEFNDEEFATEGKRLQDEAMLLKKILSAIIDKSQ